MSSPQLDHLILFLPNTPTTSLPSIPPSLSANLTLTPGGTHADNLTSNTLILLQDGTYLELITFIAPPSTLHSHWWGPDAHRTGWADWCLTGVGRSAAETYSELGLEESGYAVPRGGARTRRDGGVVRWEVTFPGGQFGGREARGRVPFFCHDVTGREGRVKGEEGARRHACGVMGVRRLEVVVVGGREELGKTRRVYKGLFGEGVEGDGGELVFEVGRVESVEGLGGVEIVLRGVREGEEEGRAGDRGFWFGDVVLAARAGEGKEKGVRERIDVEEDLGGLWIEYF